MLRDIRMEVFISVGKDIPGGIDDTVSPLTYNEFIKQVYLDFEILSSPWQ